MALFKLKAAMLLTLTLLFGFLTGILGIILYFYGEGLSVIGRIGIAVFFSVFIVGLQWYFSPSIIKMMTNMRKLEKNEYPWLHHIIEKYSGKAGIKKPRLYLVQDGTPNAFAFGRTKNNSHIAVHTGLLNALNKEEVEAVLAHEVGHVKHWDVAVITMASMIPILVYYLVILFAPRDRRGGIGSIIMVFMGALLAQFIGRLMVSYLGRTRELYADAFSAVATGKPANLRTALAKISYGFPALGAQSKKNYESTRSFYIADPISSSDMTVNRLRSGKLEFELKRSEQVRACEGGKVEASEVAKAIEWEKKQGGFREFFSSHPLTYKRIEQLEKIEDDMRSGKVTIENV